MYRNLRNVLPLSITVLLCSRLALAVPALEYAAVERAIQEGNLTWAQEVLETHLTKAPRDSRAYMLLGIVSDEQGQSEKAIHHFRKAVSLRPRDPAPHINLGKSYARSGKLDEAVSEFRSAIQLDPGSPTAHSNLGLMLMQKKEYSQALASFQRAVELTPRDLSAWLNLFKAQLALHHFREARVSGEKISQLSPPSADLYNRLGALQAEAGDYDGALRDLERASALEPGSYETRFNLGLAYYRSGNFDRSLTTLESLRQEGKAEVENLLGEVYEKKGEYLQAARAFQKAAELEPAQEGYRFDYAYELLSHQNFNEAILIIQPALHDFPGSQRLRWALGIAQFGSGLIDESLSTLLDSARRYPDAALPLFLVAQIADETTKNLDEVESLVGIYLKRHAREFWPYYFLGRTAYRSGLNLASIGKFGDARDLLRKSVELEPRHAESHFELGNVYFQLKQWQQAIECYEKSLQINPDLVAAHFRLANAYRKVGQVDRAELEEKTHQLLLKKENEREERLRQVSRFLIKLRQ